MDQHPIPQDVTGFQFKLIGTMTVKQFGYVASGVIMAFVLYYLPLPGIFGILTKVLLIPILGGSGAFIAFVPIEGRPVDVMAGNFFKAIFSPNQYIYKKTGRKFSFSTVTYTKVAPVVEGTPVKQSTTASVKQAGVDIKAAQLQAFLRSSHSQSSNSLDKKEQAMLSSLSLSTITKSVDQTTSITPALKPAIAMKPAMTAVTKPLAAPMQAPATSPQEKEHSLTQKENQLQNELQTAKQEENTTHAPAAHEKVNTLETQIQEIHTQKLKLEQEIKQLQSQLVAQKAQPTVVQPAVAAQPVVAAAAPTPIPVAPPTPIPVAPPTPVAVPASQYAKTVAQAPAKKVDLPNISDTPNVVVGIVKDPRGNILPNMLVEVKDKDGNPVRAFKTNALGQFASATPLAKGIYTIELDDPKKQHTFDVIQITASNQIMLPIEIISHDAREELRKQLFN